MPEIPITDTIAIDTEELSFTASRSSGPGGQNVNKVSSRITLRFDVAGSAAFDEVQRARIRERLATRITKDGVLWLHVQRHRSQGRNRDEAVERLVALLREALATRRPRRPTRTSKAAKRRRLENKRRRGNVKRNRGPVRDHDG